MTSEASSCGAGCACSADPAHAVDARAATGLRPSINGVPLVGVGEVLDGEVLRQRAHLELLRQATIGSGLLSPQDAAPADGILSEAASEAIETLLERAIAPREPSEDEIRRFYEGHAAHFARGERARLRHVLFAVTSGVNVAALRERAEACLLDVRSRSSGLAPSVPEASCVDASSKDRGADAGSVGDAFAQAARTLSNCPSAIAGGELGWLDAGSCVEEFAREIFGRSEVGVLPRLVHSRFGLHVVEVLAREPGVVPGLAQVHGAVRQVLQQQHYATAVRQYLSLLAGAAQVEGITLEAADSPLLQ